MTHLSLRSSLRFQLSAGLLLALAAVPALADDDDGKKWDVNDPPGDEYEFELDVTEGTWMSLDLSPDGERIVFDLLGDLYLLPIGGGDAEALTNGMAWDMMPPLQPGRFRDRLHQRPQRRRQRVDDSDRRRRAAADQPRRLPARQQPRLEPRRALHRRAQAFRVDPVARQRRDLALPRERRRRRSATEREAERPEGPRRTGLLARRAIRLLQPGHDAGRILRVRQELG